MVQADPRAISGSECVTRGFRVRVTPRYLSDQSAPDERRWVFGYRIRITNEGSRSAKLVSRRWLIVDAQGRREEVHGEGVVGEQPVITPGSGFEYASFCPLSTHWGTMEGAYTMKGEGSEGSEEGGTFEIHVDRFYLIGPSPNRPG